MIAEFPIQRIRITLHRVSPVADPLGLFRLRDPHQAALAAVSPCNGGDRCCPDPFSCPYHTAFGQELSPNPDLVRRHQKPPPPFAWLLPPPDQPAEDGAAPCTLVLVGRAAAHLPGHLRALARLFQSPSQTGYLLHSCAIPGLAGEVVPISRLEQGEPTGLPLVTWADLVREAGEPPPLVTVETVTPMRLMTAGRPATVFEPSLFLRQLMRRCSALVECYGEELLDTDFRRLADQSLRVTVLEEKLHRHRSGTPFPGLAGSFTLAGELEDFWPWLVLGQWVNVGKGAAFGCGRFRLVVSGEGSSR